MRGRESRAYVEADKRIVMGFIEPHFMAGFSGGYKGIFPFLRGLEDDLPARAGREAFGGGAAPAQGTGTACERPIDRRSPRRQSEA